MNIQKQRFLRFPGLLLCRKTRFGENRITRKDGNSENTEIFEFRKKYLDFFSPEGVRIRKKVSFSKFDTFPLPGNGQPQKGSRKNAK